jgi:hypothetical protein
MTDRNKTPVVTPIPNLTAEEYFLRSNDYYE